ncbi:MAG: hypothetical protein JXM68_06735, partial [Sedimentisphaerales bacterium]|nr:hypothetical protein [Sedimentisphaerales bacterium]
SVYKDNKLDSTISYYAAIMPDTLPACDLDINYAEGDWNTETSSPGASGSNAVSGAKGGIIFNQPTEQDGQTAISVTDNFDKNIFETRIIAIDNNNNTINPGRSQASNAGPTMTTVYFNITPDKIKSFEFQTRQYKKVRIENISLVPQKADIEIQPKLESCIVANSNKVTLENGINVDFMGICNLAQPGVSWKPDGSPLAEALPFNQQEQKHTAQAGNEVYEFLVKFAELPNDCDIKIKAEPDLKIFNGSTAPMLNGIPQNDYRFLWQEFAKEQAKCNLTVSVAVGDWRTVGIGKDTNGEGIKGFDMAEIMPGLVSLLPLAERKGAATPNTEAKVRTVVSLVHNILDKEVRIIVKDKDGKTILRSMEGDAPAYSRILENGITTTCQFDMPMKDIASLELQVRDYKSVTFKDVALKSGKLPANNSITQTTSKPESCIVATGNIATLDDGTKIELVGLCKEPTADAKWWGMNGSEMETPKYIAKYANNSMRNYPVVYSFLARISNTQEPAVCIRVYEGHSSYQSTPAADGTILCYVKQLSDTVYQDHAFEYGPIEIGVAKGEWYKMQGSGNDDINRFRTYLFGSSFEIAIQPPQREKSSPEMSTEFWFTAIRSECQIKMVCTLKNGTKQEVMSTFSSGGGIVETGNISNGKIDLSSFVIDVPIEQIVDYELYYREFEFARFDNVAFKPGELPVDIGVRAKTETTGDITLADYLGTWEMIEATGEGSKEIKSSKFTITENKLYVETITIDGKAQTGEVPFTFEDGRLLVIENSENSKGSCYIADGILHVAGPEAIAKYKKVPDSQKPTIDTNEPAPKAVMQTGKLEFRIAADSSLGLDQSKLDINTKLDGWQWLPVLNDSVKITNKIHTSKDGRTYLLVSNQPDKTMLADSSWGLINCGVETDPYGNQAIGITFDDFGSEQFLALTGSNIEKPLAICLDGEVYSVPNIMSKISGKAMITGIFSKEQATELANKLRNGMPAIEGMTANVITAKLPSSIYTIADIANRKTVEVPKELNSQEECLAYAKANCTLGLMYDNDGEISQIGFVNATEVDKYTEDVNGIKTLSFISTNTPQDIVVTDSTGQKYKVTIIEAKSDGCVIKCIKILQRPGVSNQIQ